MRARWSFKRKLLADPAATLKAEGIELPAGRSIKALADDAKVFHLVIPKKPDDLSEEDLDKVSGGTRPLFTAAEPPPPTDPGLPGHDLPGHQTPGPLTR